MKSSWTWQRLIVSIRHYKTLPIFLVLILTSSILVGVYLVQRSQNIQEKAATTLSWEEQFEGTLSNWTVSAPAGCTVRTEVSTPASPSSGKNLLIYNDGTTEGCFISKRIAPALTNGVVSLWFYDNLDPTNRMEITAAVIDDRDHRMWAGVRSSLTAQTYNIHIGDSEIDSKVTRTAGWHKFDLYIANGESFLSIDNKILRHRGSSKTLRSFTEVKLLSGWDARGAARFDGVRVEARTENLRETTTIAPSSGGGMSQTFTTRVKSINQTDYFKNVFLAMTETAPEESNSDIMAWFGIIKGTDSQWRFYGTRWLGTNSIATPNIGYKASYAYDIGGYLGGQPNTICVNTTRKATTSKNAASIACLDVAGSSVSWNATTSELVINWKVTFEPQFISIRGQRYEPSALLSTGIRKINTYINVDEPIENLPGPDTPYTNYNWKQIGTYNVGSPQTHTTLSPQQSSGDGTTFITTITHPTNASLIDTATIWLDELDPNGTRSDVAITYQAKKVNNQFVFSGRRYTGATQTCPGLPYLLVGKDCYKNYVYDVGNFAGNTQNSIYYNLDRVSTVSQNTKSTSILSLPNSKVSINPNNSRQLLIEWDISFLKLLKTRDLRVYSIWTDTQGTTNSWQDVGSHTVSNTPPNNGKIIVAGRNLTFQNGTPYSWIGINKYFLHRVFSKQEIDAYLAKMAMYNMNYLRIFTVPQNPQIDMLLYLADRAKTHGIYVNITIFSDNNATLVSSDTPPYRKSTEWIYYLLQETKDKDSVFMFDVVNDLEPKNVNWAKAMIPFVRANDSRGRLVTLQLHTNATLGSSEYQGLSNLIDVYSVRSYSSNTQTLVSQLESNYNRELSVSPGKPVFVGENRINGSNWRNDWQNQSAIYGQSMTSIVAKAKQLGISAHPWVEHLRAEYLTQGFPLYPDLTPEEFESFLAYSPAVPTGTPTTAQTSTVTPLPTRTPTPLPTRTPTPTVTKSLTPTRVTTITVSPTKTPTSIPTTTNILTPTRTPTPTINQTPTPIPTTAFTNTPIATATATITNEPVQADCDGDNKVDGIDFACWLNH
jgi:hypothetical protein